MSYLRRIVLLYGALTNNLVVVYTIETSSEEFAFSICNCAKCKEHVASECAEVTSHGEVKGFGEMQMLLELSVPPTAVFAVSDKAAIGAYRALVERGLTIPDDISIIGFDDIEEARILHPPLSTVQVSGETMGRVAVERLLSLIEFPEQDTTLSSLKWTIPTKLVKRGSVRDLRQK